MSLKNLMIVVMKTIIILMDANQQMDVGTWISADPELHSAAASGPTPGERLATARAGVASTSGACGFLTCTALSSPNL